MAKQPCCESYEHETIPGHNSTGRFVDFPPTALTCWSVLMELLMIVRTTRKLPPKSKWLYILIVRKVFYTLNRFNERQTLEPELSSPRIRSISIPPNSPTPNTTLFHTHSSLIMPPAQNTPARPATAPQAPAAPTNPTSWALEQFKMQDPSRGPYAPGITRK